MSDRVPLSGDSGLRQKRAEEARRLYDGGMTGIEVAEHMGLSRSYTYGLLTDPDGSKDRERKRKYYGVCIDCGGRTVNGGSMPPKRCQECSAAHIKANAKWTREAIIEAIQEWNRRYGSPPGSVDWNVAHPAHKGVRAQRWESGDWPPLSTVSRVFGGWNKAITAAGFEAREPYGRRGLPQAEYDRTVALYREGLSFNEIGRRLGISGSGVVVRLKHVGAYLQPAERKDVMAAPLRAVQVIEREIERMEQRAARLREELAETEATAAQLRTAQEALSVTNGAGAKS